MVVRDVHDPVEAGLEPCCGAGVVTSLEGAVVSEEHLCGREVKGIIALQKLDGGCAML